MTSDWHSRRERQRSVIVGGTFDPIHVGHLHLARAAVKLLRATGGILAVCEAHRHRDDAVLAWSDRVHLVQQACAEEPHLTEATLAGAVGRDLVEVSRQLGAPDRDLHFVFGADSARRVVEWHGAEQLRDLGTLWAAPRGRDDLDDLPSLVRRLDVAIRPVSASQIRDALRVGNDVAALIPGSLGQVESAYRRSVAVRRGLVHG